MALSLSSTNSPPSKSSNLDDFTAASTFFLIEKLEIFASSEVPYSKFIIRYQTSSSIEKFLTCSN